MTNLLRTHCVPGEINSRRLPATNIVQSMMLMGDDREATAPFWALLDQRLHNELAAAISLVDHTRRLLAYYADDAQAMVSEFRSRNTMIATLDEAVFLRDLRNYLVHYGAAPIVQAMSLGPINEVGMTGHSVKLHATRPLEWSKWKTQSRTYLQAFPDQDGPVLGKVVVAYANATGKLYTWLLQQRAAVMNTANSPERFRINDRGAGVPAERDGSDG